LLIPQKALWKPRDLRYESYIINHSSAYTIAATASWVEFWIEYLFFPSLKGWHTAFLVGTAVMVVGQFFRSAAMWTARSNFAHRIEEQSRQGHVLVTHGVYRLLRHPSYFGWFWWSVASQVVLGNPICLVAYTVASWNFFCARIPYEEDTLVRLFPEEYPVYRNRTIIGIPLISAGQSSSTTSSDSDIGGGSNDAASSGSNDSSDDTRR
jgi:protein-S-isoprenylcysteine O-methyltransferase